MSDNVISNAVLFHRKQAAKRPVKTQATAEEMASINYKNLQPLMKYLSPRGRILPSRITGTSRQEQRLIKEAVKRARFLALLPYATSF